MKRATRRIGSALAIALLAAGIAACGSRGRERADQIPPSAASRTGSRSPTTATRPQPTASQSPEQIVLGNMQTAVNGVIPAGFELIEAASGLLDLEAAASLSDDPAKERSTLSRNGFARAYALLWRREGASIAVLGYEFRTGAGAAAYERYTVDDARRNHEATSFAVPEIEAATGLRFEEAADGTIRYVKAVTFVRETTRFGIAFGAPNEPDTASTVRLAEALDRLARR